MKTSIFALFYIFARLNREQRGITAIELAVIVVVLVGIGSLFAIPDLVSNIGGAGRTTVSAPQETIEDSFASLVLLGGVVGTADPNGDGLETVVFRVGTGGRSIRVVDISVSGATLSYLDEYRAFNVPTGQWSSVWRRGNGPLLDQGEVVEIMVNLRNLYPPLGKNTDFSIRLHPIDGEVLMIRRSTPSKLKGIMELPR
jgi:Flp pilus assembly pilin Flp